MTCCQKGWEQYQPHWMPTLMRPSFILNTLNTFSHLILKTSYKEGAFVISFIQEPQRGEMSVARSHISTRQFLIAGLVKKSFYLYIHYFIYSFIPEAIMLLKKWLLLPPAGGWGSQCAPAQVVPRLGLSWGSFIMLMSRTVPDTEWALRICEMSEWEIPGEFITVKVFK